MSLIHIGMDIGMDIVLPNGAPATVVRPSSTPKGGVVVAHGGSDDGRRYFVDEAAALAERGLLVVLPATKLPEHGDIAVSSAAIERAVATYRHALDVLGEHAAGFFGHSAGAFLGALLAAADPRPKRMVLGAYGSGTVVRIAGADLAGADGAPEYLAALERFDPRHHLPGHGERIFVQHGLRDETVPVAEGRLLYEAAGPGARWAEYDCDHDVVTHLPARMDRLAYLT